MRSRSLFRLCEKLAVMDSPTATRLLPGFFLNKKAALKKAMREGVQVPGLLPVRLLDGSYTDEPYIR